MTFPMTDDSIRLAQVGILNMAVKEHRRQTNATMLRLAPHCIVRRIDVPTGTELEYLGMREDGSLFITDQDQEAHVWHDGRDVYGYVARANKELGHHGLWCAIPAWTVQERRHPGIGLDL